MGTITRQCPVQLGARLISAVAVPAQSAVSPAPDVAVLTRVLTARIRHSTELRWVSCGQDSELVPANFPITPSRARNEPKNH